MMRGADAYNESLFSTIHLEDLVVPRRFKLMPLVLPH